MAATIRLRIDAGPTDTGADHRGSGGSGAVKPGGLTFIRAGPTLLHLLLQALHLLHHLPAPLLRVLQLTAHTQTDRGEESVWWGGGRGLSL